MKATSTLLAGVIILAMGLILIICHNTITGSGIVTAGGIITDKRVENPASVPVVEVPALPDDVIMLTDPKNLVVVNSYGVVIRKTTEGPEAIYQDKRFYVVHFDFDTLVEELDATAIVTGLASI